jgi:hypothetical protein
MGRDRRKRRYRAECPAQILVPDLAPTAALAIDLSVGGTFLETEAALPLGLQVNVRLTPPGYNLVNLSGKILRVGHTEKALNHGELDYLIVRATGMAVKFDPIDKRLLKDFESYLATLEEL